MKRAIGLALLGTAMIAACTDGKRVPAIGPGSEIVVLSSGRARSLGTAVAEILAREIRVVQFEPNFTTIDDDLSEFDFYKTRKLLFVVGEPEDEQLQEVLRRATGTRKRTSFPGLWVEHEPFSAGQVLFILAGPLGAVSDELILSQDALTAEVEETAVRLLQENVFRGGEVKRARENMRARWGWGVRLPPEWVVDDRYAEQRFVRVWHDAPVMQMFVAWEDGRVDRSPQEWMEHRDALVRDFYDGDEVVQTWSQAKTGPSPFGPAGVVLDGLWENDRYVIGGPFRSWAFYCREDDRTYLIDYSVYAPDRPKLPLLRVLEAVGRTLRFGCTAGTDPEK
ncbi:MAG TPA: DUF4837 family protein [bacterium]|nr:DUF4837 family protein [bacterium]